MRTVKYCGMGWGENELGRVCWACPECGKCLWLLANASVRKLYERVISIDEVRKAVNEMKSGKASRLDGFLEECLKKCGMAVIKWLERLLNISSEIGAVLMVCRGASLVPLSKEMGDSVKMY